MTRRFLRLPRGSGFVLWLAFAMFCWSSGFMEAAAAEQQAKVVAKPQAAETEGGVVINGDSSSSPAKNPEAAAMEDRVMRYKFILESLGFSLEEIVISPDWDYQVELTFKGRLNAGKQTLEELTEKFKDEQKLMGMLRTIYDYNNRDLTNFGAYKVVLRLAKPVEIQVYYRKF